jgi:predicted transcriptional regulator
MTKEQDEAVLSRVLDWPAERQKDAVRMLLEMEKQDPYAAELTEEERADLREALAEAERGEFATDEEVEAVFARYRR